MQNAQQNIGISKKTHCLSVNEITTTAYRYEITSIANMFKWNPTTHK